MKGIFKKLFLGLFFCALICAGFSKNVKAVGPTGSDKITTSIEADGKVKVEVDLTDDPATPSGTVVVEVYAGSDSTKWGGSSVYDVTLTYDGSIWSATGGATATGNANRVTVVSDASIKSDLAEQYPDPATNGQANSNVYAWTKIGSYEKKSSNSVILYAPNIKVKWNFDDSSHNPTSSNAFDLVPVVTRTNKWLIDDETYSATITNKGGNKYLTSEARYSITNDCGKQSTSDFNEAGKWLVTDIRADQAMTYTYTYDIVTGVALSKALDSTTKVLATKKSSTYEARVFNITSALNKWKTEDVENASTDTSDIDINTASGWVKVISNSSTGTKGNKTISIKVPNGLDLEKNWTGNINVTVADAPSEIKFKSSSYDLSLGEPKNLYSEVTDSADNMVFDKGLKFEITNGAANAEVGATTGIVKGTTAGKEATLKATLTLADIFEGTGIPTTLDNTTTIKVGEAVPLKFEDEVGVSEGLDVYLADFLVRPNKEATVSVDLLGNLAKSNAPELLKNVKIAGKKSGFKKEGITVSSGANNATTDLTVYPAPSLSTGAMGSIGTFGGSSSSSGSTGLTVTVPAATYHGGSEEWVNDVKFAFVTFNSLSSGKSTTIRGSVSKSSSSSNSSSNNLSKSATVSLATVSNEISKIAKGDHDQIYITVNPESAENDMLPDRAVEGYGILNAYKITLDGSSATYKVNGESVKDYFYAINDQTYTIESAAKNKGAKFVKWEGGESDTEKIDKITFSSPRTLHAVYEDPASSSSSSSAKLTAGAGTGTGADSEGLDDVPKTGESKTDIWILWTVLLVSILGAGFMIYRRFGVVNAIAQAQADETAAIEQEKIDAEAKEKEDKLRVLKNLRDLK